MSIGKSEYRGDAAGKVTGATRYPGDLERAALLHARVMFSGQPHARMRAIDLSAAQAVPGVVAIFTAADVPLNEYGLTMHDQPVLVGIGGNGRSPVPADVSRWEGDQVAIIVATSVAAASEAMAKIAIDWEQLPILPDLEAALASDVLVHPETPAGSNAYYHLKIRKGDMAAGWAAADLIIEDEYEFPNQEHAYLQPEAALSYIDEEGRVTVEVAGQWTYEDQEQIAHALDLPADQIRVIYPAIGGAFGGREDMSLQIVMALAAWKLHQRGETRPIRTVWSREESIIGHHKRHRGKAKARLGATRDGIITAVEADLYLDAGAYNYTSNKVLGNAHVCVGGPYNIPNARIDSYAVYTNAVPGGAFRGFGAPQGALVAEGQINKLAAALGMDPVEIRLKNCLTDESISITQSAMPPGVSMAEVIQKCADAAGWENGLQANPQVSSFASLPTRPEAIRVGRGFACAYKNVGFSFGFPERCEATIELHGQREIERVVLRHGGADVGQGGHTAFRQMAAAATGVPLDRVEIVASDTATSGDSGSASASRLTFMAGNSIRQAATEALAKWDGEDRPAIGYAKYVPPATEALDPETGICNPNFSYGYVAEYVEVAVDVETGHLELHRVVCADDVGKAINPQLVTGQIEGAIVQAYGYAVTEKLRQENGHILNPRLSTYLIPGIRDIPHQVDSVIVEVPDPLGPWGARGMAEMPFIPLAPAIAAAIHDATGVWLDTIPFTPGWVSENLIGT